MTEEEIKKKLSDHAITQALIAQTPENHLPSPLSIIRFPKHHKIAKNIAMALFTRSWEQVLGKREIEKGLEVWEFILPNASFDPSIPTTVKKTEKNLNLICLYGLLSVYKINRNKPIYRWNLDKLDFFSNIEVVTSFPANLIGLRFGKSQVIGKTRKKGDPSGRWLCLCDCGKSFPKNGYSLDRSAIHGCLECREKIALSKEAGKQKEN